MVKNIRLYMTMILSTLIISSAWAESSNNIVSNNKENNFDKLIVTYHENKNIKSKEYFYNGKKEGKNEYFSEDGMFRYTINYNQGERDNISEYFFNNKLISKINYKENIKDGEYVTYYPDGSILTECIYKDNKKNGVCSIYYNSGQLYIKENYKDDFLNGIRSIYYENGSLKEECTYERGYKIGLYKSYHDNGKIKEESSFKDGKKFGQSKLFNSEGYLEGIDNYINGLLDGTSKRYYKNNSIQVESNYKNNLLDGIFKSYYSNGKIHKEGSYQSGKPVGMFKVYNEQGNLTKENIYVDKKEEFSLIPQRKPIRVYEEKPNLLQPIESKQPLRSLFIHDDLLPFKMKQTNSSFYNLLKDKIAEYWKARTDNYNYKNHAIIVNIKLNKHGDIISLNMESNENNNEPIFCEAVNAAILAIIDAQEFDNVFRLLAQYYNSHYNDWKEIRFTFNLFGEENE
ncbi:MAG: toxin-antitoxin system YwqK family antitoxin [Alphaproteobacteria bacterium]|nr:toxin-antitoxin system YwqK family antitoxin [Alphaproteobacteria bacterium]